MNKTKFRDFLITKPEIKVINNKLNYTEQWKLKPTIPNNIKQDKNLIYDYLIDTQQITIDQFFIDALSEYNPNYSLEEHDRLKEYFNNIVHYNPNIESFLNAIDYRHARKN